MPNSQKTDDVEPLPIVPRIPIVMDQGEDGESHLDVETSDAQKKRRKRTFTPVTAMKIQYWHQGGHSKSRPSVQKSETFVKGKSHAKKADQLGVLFLWCALLVLILVAFTLYMNDKKYLFSTSKPTETITAVVDFYQGNHTFSEKVAEEKAAKAQINGHPVHGISPVNDNLEVPLSEQASSMSEKMQQMRSLQQADEAPPPTQDTGPKIDTAPLKPTKDENFQAPLEFTKDLPKALQTNQ